MMLLTHHCTHQRRGVSSSTTMKQKSFRGASDYSNNRLSPIPEEKSCHDWHEDLVDPVIEGYSTFHFLINQERKLRGRQTLYRSSYLDLLALNQAKRMASQNYVMHSVHTIEELQELLGSTKAGENVQRGENPLVMHELAMNHHQINKSNILSECFNEFGVGVATGNDGYLYVCQLFRGIDHVVTMD